MRPLRLQIKGLRSFRSEVEIDFRDLGLVAIVGDTGAGKSSILEAITYALYNATTWDKRGVKQLISDNTTTMSVQLDFAADGQAYRITRSTSRGPYPPPGHSLECLSDPTIRPRDGEDAVKEEVVRLVGLDWDGFTSAVILPQGRFQTLLQASPADRTDILKGIFRLHELGAIRDQAQSLAGEYRATLDDLQAERAQLLPDPQAAAREAAERKRNANKEATTLRRLKGQVTEQEKTANHKADLATRLRSAATLLDDANTHPARALHALHPVLADLDRREAKLARDEAGLQRSEASTRAALERADTAGEGESALVRAQTVLTRVITEIPELVKEKKRIEHERQTLELDRKQLAASDASLDSLRATAAAKGDTLESTEQKALATAAALQNARERLDAYRHKALDKVTAAETLAGLEIEQQQTEQELATARDAEKEAQRDAAAAAAALAELQRKHAAAHAAEGLAPGDACPICSQTLPAAFKPPRVPAERAASTASDKARRAETVARDARVKLEERHRQLTKSIGQARTTSTTAAQSAQLALRHLRAALADRTVSPELSDDVLLQPLATRLREEQTATATARAQAETARQAVASREAELHPRRDALNERRQALERSSTAHAARAKAVEDERLTLPERFRPAAAASADRMRSLLERLDERVDEVTDLRRTREALQEQLAKLRSERDELEKQRKREFEKPRQQTERAVLLLHNRLRDATKLASCQAPVLPELEHDFGAFVEAVAALERFAMEVVDALRAGADDAEHAAEQAHETICTLLQQAHAATIEALDEQLIAAAAALARANEDEALARAQIPQAAALDKKLGPLREATETLDALASLLTDGRFIGFVVGRRQRALLGIASEILGSMTGARYGFAEDFRIIDRISGQPRGARTLSGGEAFLASLALALGLVELAARSGGRLEALFLDEGFGSLDADALEEALAELERRAASGRLVAVISHIRTVAEHIETVLRVNYRTEGTEVLRVTGAEREEFITEEIEQGLLA